MLGRLAFALYGHRMGYLVSKAASGLMIWMLTAERPGTSIEGEGVEGEEGGKWVGGGGLRCGFVLLTRRYGRLVDCGPLPITGEGKEGCVQGIFVLSGRKERWLASYQAGSGMEIGLARASSTIREWKRTTYDTNDRANGPVTATQSGSKVCLVMWCWQTTFHHSH